MTEHQAQDRRQWTTRPSFFDTLYDVIDENGTPIAAAVDELTARLIAAAPGMERALEFYADPWEAQVKAGVELDDISVPDFWDEMDFGARARAALASAKPGEAKP